MVGAHFRDFVPSPISGIFGPQQHRLNLTRRTSLPQLIELYLIGSSVGKSAKIGVKGEQPEPRVSLW
jgi:hypothetical protein